MNEPIHIGNVPKSREVLSFVAFVVVAPFAIGAGLALLYYNIKDRKDSK